MEQYGFKDGDKIVSIDGTPFAETDNISTHLMFRKTGNIKVKRIDGTVEELKLPENIGTQLFEAGDIPALSPRQEFNIDSIIPDSPASKAGLMATDKILSVDGKEVNYFTDFTYALKNRKGASVSLEVERDSAIKTLTITPSEDSKIGISILGARNEFQHRDYSFGESVVSGFSVGYWTVKDYLAQFKYIFTKKGAAQIGGFAAIGKMFPATWDWAAFWQLTAFLSIMLAVLNLLPIPALDGGHVMFLLYEMVSGRKPGDKFMEYAQMVGFFILIALVLFANGNDIFKAIFN
jgi:regulator of sigma E protease